MFRIIAFAVLTSVADQSLMPRSFIPGATSTSRVWARSQPS